MKPTGHAPVRLLDVRPVIAAGESPRELIHAALERLGPGDSLRLVTPFLPSPLIEKLQAEGLIARPTRRNDGAWETLFTR